MTNEKECPERVFIETDNKGDYHTCPRGFHDAEYVRADLLLAREGDDSLARTILRSVRGCATDSQYIDALERAQVALATVRAEERKAVWDEAIRRASAVRGRFQQLGGAFKRDGMVEAEERNASGIEAADRIVRALERGREATENRKGGGMNGNGNIR